VSAPTDPAGDALDAARRALDASREAVARTVTARAGELAEASRLEARAGAGGALGDLEPLARAHAARAAALEPRIEQLRDLARRAEVAYASLRTAAGGPTPADVADDERPGDDAGDGDGDPPAPRA